MDFMGNSTTPAIFFNPLNFIIFNPVYDKDLNDRYKYAYQVLLNSCHNCRYLDVSIFAVYSTC